MHRPNNSSNVPVKNQIWWIAQSNTKSPNHTWKILNFLSNTNIDYSKFSVLSWKNHDHDHEHEHEQNEHPSPHIVSTGGCSSSGDKIQRFRDEQQQEMPILVNVTCTGTEIYFKQARQSHTWYLEFFLHQRNLRPEDFTPKNYAKSRQNHLASPQRKISYIFQKLRPQIACCVYVEHIVCKIKE